MGEGGNRASLEKFFQALNDQDWDAMAKLLDHEYVWEMPQSGERVRGLENNQAMNQNYPGLPTVEDRRITGSEDKWVITPTWTILKITGTGDDYTSEGLARYPDGSEWHAVDIIRFREGKIVHHKSYFAAPIEAPEWRSRWVESI